MMGDVTVEHSHRVLPHMLEMLEQRFELDCRIKLIPEFQRSLCAWTTIPITGTR